MKYIEEFRDIHTLKKLATQIVRSIDGDKHYNLMEFCGGHTHVLHRFALTDILPSNIHMIHGPGCPVCVLPTSAIDYAIKLSQLPNTIFCSYADMLRVPGSNRHSLQKARAEGADVRMVYSIRDALAIAEKFPDKEVVFFAIGFETTTPPTAYALIEAKAKKRKNFSIYCNHVLTTAAMTALLKLPLEDKSKAIQGFLGPAHVSIIIGANAYTGIAKQYKKPIVISGFEPLDMMQSIYLLVDMINQNKNGVVNQYTRAVSDKGSLSAQSLIEKTMTLRDKSEWRGLGYIEHSSLKIRETFQDYDAEYRFPLSLSPSKDHKQCDCGDILRGLKSPKQCKLFAKVCTPESPFGACMVSSEGACAAAYLYQRRSQNHAKAEC